MYRLVWYQHKGSLWFPDLLVERFEKRQNTKEKGDDHSENFDDEVEDSVLFELSSVVGEGCLEEMGVVLHADIDVFVWILDRVVEIIGEYTARNVPWLICVLENREDVPSRYDNSMWSQSAKKNGGQTHRQSLSTQPACLLTFYEGDNSWTQSSLINAYQPQCNMNKFSKLNERLPLKTSWQLVTSLSGVIPA